MKYKSSFQAFMHRASIISFACILLFFLIHAFAPLDLFYSLGITALTAFYHFAMRLFLGEVLFHRLLRNMQNYNARWFEQKRFEPKLYKVLKLKKWKVSIPTYDPSEFSMQEKSPEEIVIATCRSEIIHETNVVVSFVPLLFTLFFGAFPVFLITSIIAACIDLIFVFLQRYNRPRLIKLMEHRKKGAIAG